jgi:hypothetical protein
MSQMDKGNYSEYEQQIKKHFSEFRQKIRRATSPEELHSLFDENLRPKNFHEVIGHLSIIFQDLDNTSRDQLPEAEKFFQMFFAPDRLKGDLHKFAKQLSSVMFEWTLSRSLLNAGWSVEKLHSRRNHVRGLMNNWWQYVAKAFLTAEIVEMRLGSGSCSTDHFWIEWNEISKCPDIFNEYIQSISGTDIEMYLRLLA